MSAADEYLRWRRGPEIGCVFARAMSKAPGDYGQLVEEIDADDPAAVATNIANRVQQLVPTPGVLAVVLPGIETLEKLMAMALALPTDPTWHVDAWQLDPPPEIDLAAVRVVRDLPFGNGTLPSEALALGDFDMFPKTRRAPRTAFEIYVGEPAPQDPKTHTPSTKANFAHIDFRDRKLINRYFTQAAVDAMWEKSNAGLPTAMAKKMGCLS